MRADFKVVLDACVLANYSVANLLLSLGEKPRLYLPVWSEEILAETRRTQVGRLEWPERIADSFQTQLRAVFPESLAQGFEHLIGECTNDKKDRHVLACAIHSKAEVILTFNRKDFPEESLSRWQVSAEHPQDYLIMLFRLELIVIFQENRTGCSNHGGSRLGQGRFRVGSGVDLGRNQRIN